MAKLKKGEPAQAAEAKIAQTGGVPSYFVSYSTGERQVELFVECLEKVFGKYFEMHRTPSVLKVGESQHDEILELIGKCAFGVVCLDGLRPNVVFENGAMRGAKVPVLVFKESSASVDIGHFFDGVVDLALKAPRIDLDKHFSDTKDRFYATWSRYEIEKTLKTIWEAYDKSCAGSSSYVKIPEPKL